MKIFQNMAKGMLSVLTASQAPDLQHYPHRIMADGLLKDWQGVAKDIKRVQRKLKAEAHDGQQRKK